MEQLNRMRELCEEMLVGLRELAAAKTMVIPPTRIKEVSPPTRSPVTFSGLLPEVEVGSGGLDDGRTEVDCCGTCFTRDPMGWRVC